MHRLLSTSLLLLSGALFIAQGAFAQDEPEVKVPRPTATITPNIRAAGSELLATGQVKKLSPKAAQAFFKSTEGGAWRAYAVQAPLCERLERKKPKETSVKDWKAKTKQCLLLNAECRKAQAIAKKYSVQNVCSTIYYETDVLLTTAAEQ